MKTFKTYLTESARYPTSAEQLDKVLHNLRLSQHELKLKIHPDFSISVFVDVDLSDYYASTGIKLDNMPVNFKTVRGVFDCSSNNFTSIDGAPEDCDGFICSHNKLTSLAGGPKVVYGDYMAAVNSLTSFDGIAEYIDGNLTLTNNDITSLKGIHKQIKYLDGFLLLPEYATSNLLGLLKISMLKGVTWIDAHGSRLPGNTIELHRIITPYINLNRGPLTNDDILDCQNELLDAGFEDAAQF